MVAGNWGGRTCVIRRSSVALPPVESLGERWKYELRRSLLLQLKPDPERVAGRDGLAILGRAPISARAGFRQRQGAGIESRES